MFYIAICDDDAEICTRLEQIVYEYGNTAGIQIESISYYTGEKLLEDMKQGKYFDLLILDIELPLINGVKVGKRIRMELKNEIIHIAYISSRESYAMELFEVRPINFLIKPLNKVKVKEVIEKGIRLSNKWKELFQYKQGHILKKRNIKDILYFESMNRQVKIITVDGEENFYSSLADVYSRVKKHNFFYSHKSYLVNYQHIVEFKYNYLTVSNGETIPISQSRRKSVREYQIEMETEKDESYKCL